MAKAVKKRGPEKKRVIPKAGAEGRAESVAPGEVIEGTAIVMTPSPPVESAHGLGGATMESDIETAKVAGGPVKTEHALLPELPQEPKPEEPKEPEPGDPKEPEVEATLKNGSVITAETVLRCGKCGATFYAKGAPDGSCPATNEAADVCGGVLGPIQV